MCLLVLASRLHPRFDLVVAANRDELHARRTLALHRWPGEPSLLAGRDLAAGGTWLGVTESGRFAAVTNFAGSVAPDAMAPSRGALVTGFLRSAAHPREFLEALRPQRQDYAGFNLLLAAEDGEPWYASNRDAGFARALAPGIYGLSNALLDTPWPKLRRARAGLAQWLDEGTSHAAPLHALLEDRSQAEDGPDAATLQQRRSASAAFIVDPVYGTRSSTIVLREPQGATLIERLFDAAGRPAGESTQRLTVPEPEARQGPLT